MLDSHDRNRGSNEGDVKTKVRKRTKRRGHIAEVGGAIPEEAQEEVQYVLKKNNTGR